MFLTAGSYTLPCVNFSLLITQGGPCRAGALNDIENHSNGYRTFIYDDKSAFDRTFSLYPDRSGNFVFLTHYNEKHYYSIQIVPIAACIQLLVSATQSIRSLKRRSHRKCVLMRPYPARFPTNCLQTITAFMRYHKVNINGLAI